MLAPEFTTTVIDGKTYAIDSTGRVMGWIEPKHLVEADLLVKKWLLAAESQYNQYH